MPTISVYKYLNSYIIQFILTKIRFYTPNIQKMGEIFAVPLESPCKAANKIRKNLNISELQVYKS